MNRNNACEDASIERAIRIKIQSTTTYFVQAPPARRRVAQGHVHRHDRPAAALLDGGLEGRHVRRVHGRPRVLVLVHGEAVDPHARGVGRVAQVRLHRLDELGEAALPRVRHEVERQPDLRQVHEESAVREALRARHLRELGPLVHDVAGRELLVVGDDADGLVGHGVEALEAAVRDLALDPGLEPVQLLQGEAPGGGAEVGGGVGRSVERVIPQGARSRVGFGEAFSHVVFLE